MSELELIQKLDEIKALTALSAKNILSLAEAAVYMDYNEDYLRKLVKTKEIKSFRAKSGKVYLRKSDLDIWMTYTEVRTQEEIEEEAKEILKKKGRVA